MISYNFQAGNKPEFFVRVNSETALRKIVENDFYHSKTLEKMIIYRGLHEDNKLWSRPYDTFFDEVNKNGQKYRFELQEIKSKIPATNKVMTTGCAAGLR